VRIFYDLDKQFSAIAVVGIGDECLSYNETEQIDEWKEAIRLASATGCRALQDLYIRTIFVESFGHAESSAEGCGMGVWMYQELKNQEKQKNVPRLELYDVRSKEWAKLMGFNAYLAAAKGSCEPPVFLEAVYYGCEPDVAPIVLVGKGVTFDSGGLCRKDYQEMQHMRGDMAGAACVVATCRAVAALQLPINLRCLIPLLESLPGPCAMKPGDIVRAKNGKSTLIETTDFDGRLGLADAFCYASNYNPKVVVSVATMRPEMRQTLGIAATGVFSNNDVLYEQMRVASIHTGDRSVDVGNCCRILAAPCAAAAFLREFLPPCDWLHMDTYSVNMTEGDTVSYLRRGMTGRPTRTLIEFLAQFACKSNAAESGQQAPAS
ncbi:hypothetical protein AAG570_012291, partial [Ranatra chinensis]